MKSATWLLLVSWLWLLACGSEAREHAPSEPAYMASDGCRLKTLADWQTFLEASAEGATWVKTCGDLDDCAATTGDFAEHVQRDIVQALAKCAPDLRATPRLAACTANLRRFAPAWLRQHQSDAYGFEQPNQEYFAAQVGADAPPGMMDPPAALLNALPARAAVEAAAQQNGWASLTHDSCLGGTRTFIHVQGPDERFEQWLLYGIDPAQPNLSQGQLVSFIAIQKQTADGTPLGAVRLHFRDYTLALDPAGWKVDLPVGGPGKCYACHTSGVRQLLTYPDGAAAFNEQLGTYGLPDWNGTIEPDDYGPALGSALGCTHCHDGQLRGKLTVFTSEGMLYQKLLQQLSMRAFSGTEAVPDLAAMALQERERAGSEPLTDNEQQALDAARAQHRRDLDALMGSRLSELQAWLLTVRCD